ncbi:hypothetical protein PENSPDRAFT_748146 [Peniophora sp. CONT]|nr:hypothetical protein PENSPDRAFT_748146 [Peniophora sp. CONT]
MAALKSDDLQLLRLEFMNVIWQNAYPLMAETALFSLHAVLTAYFLWNRSMDRKTAPHAIYMLIVAVSMFALLSAYWAIDMYNLLEFARGALEEFALFTGLESLDTPSVFAADDRAFKFELAQQSLACAILLLGDYVVLWRAYVIFGRPRWLRITTIVLAVVFTAAYSFLVATGLQSFGRMVNIIPNLIATLLVAYKAWAHWKNVRTFTTETGTRYSLAIILISYAIIALLVSGVAANVFVYVSTPLFTMYPILVIVLVATRRNLLERSIEAASSTSNTRWGIHQHPSVRGGEGRDRRRCPTCQRIDGDAFSQELIPRLDTVDFGPSVELQDVRLDPKNEVSQQHLIPRSSHSNSSDHTLSDEDLETVDHRHALLDSPRVQ